MSNRYPRLALGTVQRGVDPRPVVWALLALLHSRHRRVQHFLSQACFPTLAGGIAATGNRSRHLDSWVMPREICREVFFRGARKADLSVIDGRYDACARAPQGGSLDQLCDWLDLPRLVVLDVTQLGHCRLPRPSFPVDGLLLDRVGDADDLRRWRVELEPLFGAPVLAALPPLDNLRAEITGLACGSSLPQTLCAELGRQLGRHAALERLARLADRRPLIATRGVIDLPRPTAARTSVAVAYDDAFHCYFPLVLELLELAGARVIDFSPLADEHLPGEADVVYFGCGHPERYAEALAENHCLKLSIRNHVCRGGRVYGEGGGGAYLCQHLETAAGARYAMAGVVPAIAHVADPQRPLPVEIELQRETWLGPTGERFRGYLNRQVGFQPLTDAEASISRVDDEVVLLGDRQAIASRIHLDFAVQGGLLRKLLRPAHPAAALVARDLL